MIKLLLTFKGKTLDEFLLPDDKEIVIGSDPDCTLPIESLAIEPRHICITPQDNVFALEDISHSAGMFVNNNKIKHHELKNGDMIRIGKHVLKFFHEESKKGFDAMPQEKIMHATTMGWLQIMSGSQLGKTIQLSGAVTNISKSAAIARRNDGYYITPLQQDDLPHVGGEVVTQKSRLLNDGDILEISTTKMQFYLTGK